MSELRFAQTVARMPRRVAPQLAPGAKQLLWRSVYELMSLGRRDLSPLLNYGYAPLDASAEEEGPEVDLGADRFGLQLYSVVAGTAELCGRDVLEVGCGRGGGTAFVFERFRPRRMTGLDLARQAIRLCRTRYARPGLDFVAGNAERLPFADGSFDVVLSVESSHCYGDLSSFLRETRRVLRPDGLLLLADLRATEPTRAGVFAREDVEELRERLLATGFRTLEDEDITANVVRALELDTPLRRARIEQRAPRLLRRQLLGFAAIKGSPVYRAFAERVLTYRRFMLARA